MQASVLESNNKKLDVLAMFHQEIKDLNSASPATGARTGEGARIQLTQLHSTTKLFYLSETVKDECRYITGGQFVGYNRK